MLMIQKSLCVVCDTETSGMQGRCTNGCCAKCHMVYCSPGGITSPGHGIDVDAARKKEGK